MRNTVQPDSPLLTAAAPLKAPWGALIPEDQWEVFTLGTDALSRAGVPALLGGAMALATYTLHWRNTKDVDLIVRPRDHESAVRAVRDAGFADYFEQQAYDRSWIYRAFKDGVLFDIIWDLPNHRVQVDEGWFERAPSLRIRDRLYAAVPAEELVRIKLYVMQRERCDWVDVLNVLASACDRMDWTWLVRRMGRDLPLLHGVLAVFNWMCPGRARSLPEWVRSQFALPAPESDDLGGMEERRVRLFDSRPWFALHQPGNVPLDR